MSNYIPLFYMDVITHPCAYLDARLPIFFASLADIDHENMKWIDDID